MHKLGNSYCSVHMILLPKHFPLRETGAMEKKVRNGNYNMLHLLNKVTGIDVICYFY